MNNRTLPLRAVLTVLLTGAVAAGFAQTERPLCSQIPASEREQARATGACRDAPTAVLPRAIETAPTVRAPATIAVPDLRGQMFNVRDTRIARFKVVTSSRAGEQAKGWVLDQSPLPPARLAAGGELKIVLSDGSLVRVPQVHGGESSTAQAVLKRAGLASVVREVPGEPKGRVLSQTPQENALVKRGSKVTLGVAQGRIDDVARRTTETGPLTQLEIPSNTVPDLRGQMFNPGDERIARFRVVTESQAGEQARGWVLDQDPRPPSRLARGGVLRVFLSDNSLVRVPRVRDGTLANAQAMLKRVGLEDIVREEPQEPRGRVLSQSPQENTLVKRGSAVTLRVAAGAATPPQPAPEELLPVPNVVGLPFEEARAPLRPFSIQRSHREAIEPGGTVIDQDPLPPARRPAGAPVRVVLSDGSLVRVPRFIEMSVGEARQRMAKSTELKLQTTVVTGSTRAGIVVGQDPAPGAVVKRGSLLRLQISAGPEGPEMIDVPNVVRLPLQRAQARLERFKVEWTEQPSRAPVGQVISQAPRTPARAAPGSTVQLVVSSGVAPAELFELPNVIGRPFDDAQRVLAEFRVTRTPKGSSAPRDEVLAQTPAAGAMVSPGSAVALEVSDGSRVRVPELTNMPVAAARDAAESAGVRLQPADAPADAIVAAQAPDAGIEVRRGSGVLVELAPAPPPPAPTPPAPTPPAPAPTPPPSPPAPTPSAPTLPPPPSVPPPSAPTLFYALGGATLLGFGALLLTPGGRSLLKRVTRARPPSQVQVSARLDAALAATHIEGAEPTEPEVSLSARLDPGATTIQIEESS